MDEVIEAWKEAYRKANGTEPSDVEYDRGWYTLDRRKLRRKDLERMTKVLLSRAEKNVNYLNDDDDDKNGSDLEKDIEPTPLKVFVCRQHTGVYMPGCSVIIHKNEDEAKKELYKQLIKQFPEKKDRIQLAHLQLEELDLSQPQVDVLFDGDD